MDNTEIAAKIRARRAELSSRRETVLEQIDQLRDDDMVLSARITEIDYALEQLDATGDAASDPARTPNPAKKPRQSIQAMVLQFVTEHGGATREELLKGIARKPGQIIGAIDANMKKHRLAHRDGVYRLPGSSPTLPLENAAE